MKVRVKLTQRREGYVDIEANDIRDALEQADMLYNQQGRELPDMEETGPIQLSFYSVLDKVKEQEEEPTPGVLSAALVEKYLKKQGRPDADVDWYLCECEYHEQRAESVLNDYDLCDADRWFSLMNVLNSKISFRAAMFIENALWEEGLEALEITEPSQLLDTPESLFKDRLFELMGSMTPDGILPENPANVTTEDILALASVLHLEDRLPQNRTPAASKEKQSLSSLIHSAEERSAEKQNNPIKRDLSIEI